MPLTEVLPNLLDRVAIAGLSLSLSELSIEPGFVFLVGGCLELW